MKVGTDGVLLGAWAAVEGAGSILDIGTGTGLIALMVAQRNEAARVTAVDIDPASIVDARRNVAASPWQERIEVVECDIAGFSPGSLYDAVVSNPPYFSAALQPSDAGRAAARHTGLLTFDTLLESVDRLLTPDGRFSLVLPVDEGRRFRMSAEGVLHLVHITEVWSTPHSGPVRELMEFRRPDFAGAAVADRLVIDDGSGYSPGYRSLTEDFYLKF